MPDNRALLISQVFYPDEVAVANLFTNLCSELIKSGMEIEVWCAQPSYSLTERQPRSRVYQGIKIYYLKSSNFPKDKILGRLINFMTFALSVITRLVLSREKVQIISHTTPPFLAIIIAFLCSFKNRRFLYVIMDVFPDGLIRLKKVSLRNIFIRIWRLLHRAALKRCDRIIVIGRDMEEWLISFYPEGAEKVEYIPLWQDEILINPIDFKDNPFVSTHQLQEYFVVQYSGNMGLWNDMEAIGRVVKKNTHGIFFLFIGDGIRKKELQESIGKPSSANALFLPFQSNDNYSISVSACHAALVTLREGLEGMAVPSKIIGIMAAGIPVIAMVPEHSEIAYIVGEEKCGLVLSPSDSNGLINALLKLKSDNELRQKMGMNGRIAFMKKYTTKIVAEKYSIILRN